MYQKYAFKIRKSDLPLLALLNNGVAPEVEKGNTYLIVTSDPDGYNQIIDQKTLNKLNLKAQPLTVHVLKK